MAVARLLDILSLTNVFMLVSTLKVVQGSVIPNAQLKQVLHGQNEMEDKLHAIKDDVEAIRQYLFDEENRTNRRADNIANEGCMTDVNLPSSALISGKKYQVPDGGLTSSGSWDVAHGPRCSRLGVPKPSGCYSYSWSGKDRFTAHQWLQVDLGRTFDIETVATQGRGLGDPHAQWLKTYKIASLHGSKYVYYKDQSHGGGKIFQANVDRTTVVRTTLAPPIRARYVRLYPLTWHGHPSVRWELYGKTPPEK